MSIQGKNGEELTNFSVHLQHLYRLPNDPSSLILNLTVTQGTCHQSLTIPYNKLNQLDIQQLVPGCVYLAPNAKREVGKQIRLSLAQALRSETQVGTLYSQSGWYQHSSGRIFVAGGAALSAQGVATPANSLIAGDVAKLKLAVDSTLTPAESSEQLLRILIEYEEYAIPVFSYTLYSVLHSVWPEVHLPTACVLNLIGTQGFGKSTLARNFCSLYDNPAGQIADFYDAQSTPASMRRALGEAKDRIVVVDDLCKSTSPHEMQKRRNLAAALLRNAANESPISKMNGNTTFSSVCQSGLVLTGELPLEVPSDVTRCVIIDVNRPLHSGNTNTRMITATATAAYIQWLCAHFSEEMNCLRNDYQIFCEKDTTKSLWRLKKSLFQLDWAFNSFLRFAKSTEAISDVAHQQLRERSGDITQRIFSYEETLVQRIENAQPSRWRSLILEGTRKGILPYIQKPGCICIKPSDLTQFLRIALHNPALQEQRIIASLKSQNLLLMDKSGKSTKKVAGTRMLHISTAR